MEPNERIAQLESEIKVLKNEVQAVLLDLRDKYLEAENPFNAPPPQATTQQLTISQQPIGNQDQERQLTKPDDGCPNVEDDVDNEREQAERTRQEEGVQAQPSQEEAKRPSQRPDETRGATAARVWPSGQPNLLSRQMNLLTISGLAKWADESVRKLGRERTETLLDFSEMMGLLEGDLRHVMSRLINVDTDGDSDGCNARDYLDSLIVITKLLGKDNTAEETLISILSPEDNHR